MIHHFYHLYADGFWVRPLLEHLKAIRSLPGEVRMTVGVVGKNPALRESPKAWLEQVCRVVEFDSGYEQCTLDLLYEDLLLGEIDGPVLYAHTKGAANVSGLNDEWRRCMTRNLIARADRPLQLLAEGADTVGCHWLTPEQHPTQVQVPYYGGNFWWSSPEHLMQLPAPSHESRYHAEAWLGTVRPARPVDLAPGWPGIDCPSH